MLNRLSAVAVLAVLLVTACSRGATTGATTSPTGSAVAASPQSMVWTNCGGGFQCGSVPVPLDYSHPSGDTIRIALLRKPAADQAHRIGSVLINPGGPGGSGIEFLRGEAPSMTNLNRRLDLVGFDPRGVGQSAPVRCLDAQQEDAFIGLDSVLDDPQEKQAAIQADQDFATGCEQRSAKILPFIDTVSAARDMDVIRAAVGDAQLTYFGFSYGTFLGQTYAHLFPTHVRALVLDGVVDPNLSANDLLLADMVGYEQNLQAWLADCRARTSCAYGRSGDPAVKLNALLQRLDTNPIPVGDRLLTRALAITGVQTAFFYPVLWNELDQALTRADQGDGRVLALIADLLTGRNADGSYTNELEANIAINCLDRPVPHDIGAYDQLAAAMAKASPTFGPAFQYSNLICAYWPVPATGEVGPLTADGAPPILVVGGTNDPATPYAWAVSVSRQLAGSVLLTRRGNGHTSYDQSACAHQAIDDYLVNFVLPAPGTVCT
jgi:pimeloyl-ACP methyl ester carboxylesterase